jgi:hypothetical protein
MGAFYRIGHTEAARVQRSISVFPIRLTASTLAVRAEGRRASATAACETPQLRRLADGRRNVQVLRTVSTVTEKSGEKLEDITYTSASFAFQETRTMPKQGGMTMHRGFTGSVFWQSYENGFTMPICGEAAAPSCSATIWQRNTYPSTRRR